MVRLGLLSFSSIDAALRGGVEGTIATSADTSEGDSYAITDAQIADCCPESVDLVAKSCREVAACTSAVKSGLYRVCYAASARDAVSSLRRYTSCPALISYQNDNSEAGIVERPLTHHLEPT